MEHELIRLSKFLSYVLRHHPEKTELSMDGQGWIAVDDLLHSREAKSRGLTLRTLERIIAQNDKQRFEFDVSRTRIRARQGHSLRVDLGLPATSPPEHLYHGTAAHALKSIRKTGLVKAKRQHVHLSGDPEAARRVGARHGTAVVLTVRAGDMHEHGHQFFVTPNGVWLVEAVPSEFLIFDDQIA